MIKSMRHKHNIFSILEHIVYTFKKVKRLKNGKISKSDFWKIPNKPYNTYLYSSSTIWLFHDNM